MPPVGYSKDKNIFFAFEGEEVVTVFNSKEKHKYFKSMHLTEQCTAYQ